MAQRSRIAFGILQAAISKPQYQMSDLEQFNQLNQLLFHWDVVSQVD